MAFWKAVNGSLTLPGVEVRVNEMLTGHSVPVVNVSGPGMANGDRADHDFGNKTWTARLRGRAHDSTAGFIRAVGGSFTWTNGTITLSTGRIRKEWPLDNVTGPGDSGVVKWSEGIPRYTAGLRGWVGGTVFEGSDVDPTGTLTIKPGASNEQITGTAILRGLDTQSDYTRGGPIPCAIQAVYKNDATVTAGSADMISAGPSGTLTLQVGDSSGVAGTDYQELSGAVKLRSIEFQFDMATGVAVPVEFEARWSADPTP